MSKRLDETLGYVGPDNLIADMYPPADIFTVNVKTGQGTLKRGSLLALADSGMELIATATTGKANAVLAEPVDTGETTGNTVPAIAYRTGHFNANVLIVAEGYTITAADKEALRTAGILLSDAVEI